MKEEKNSYTWAFILVTLCFALWGIGGSLTNPMVKAFSKIFKMSVLDGTLVQLAWCGGYFAMALPAAIFIRKHSYRSGILLGLAFMAAGSWLFCPAAASGAYYPFLIAYFIVTCGQSFLETSSNPFMITLGDRNKAAYRLNLAQSFNPIGNLLGMYAAMTLVQERLSPLTATERAQLSESDFEAVKSQDLWTLCDPYLLFGSIAMILAILIYMVRLPESKGDENKANDYFSLKDTLARIIKDYTYKAGFVAQFFYVGAQVMCWTFIIQYGTEVFISEGMSEDAAEVLSQKYNMMAMVLFCTMRFICTFLMKYIRPSILLSIMAVMASLMTLGVIAIGGYMGIVCLVGISGCMSLMFPTIYSLALRNLDCEDSKIGAAGQVMAILGGSILPLIQALIIDKINVGISFAVPMICFVVIAVYSTRTMMKYDNV